MAIYRKGGKSFTMKPIKCYSGGALFNAPDSIREHYRPVLEPLPLGGEGQLDSIIGNTLEQQEIALLDQFVQEMQAIPVPSRESVRQNGELGTQYVQDVLNVAEKYIRKLGDPKSPTKFDYFSDELATIRENISHRVVVADPPPQPVEAIDDHPVAEIQQQDELSSDEESEKTQTPTSKTP